MVRQARNHGRQSAALLSDQNRARIYAHAICARLIKALQRRKVVKDEKLYVAPSIVATAWDGRA